MRKWPFIIACLGAGAVPALAADWSALPPLPTPRYGSAGAAIGSSFYVIGGNSGADLADVSVWDAASAGWTAAPAMSTTRQFPGAASLAGALYAIGGMAQNGTPASSVERFDPAAQAWSAMAPMPGGRSLAGVTAEAGVVYVMSGEGIAGAPQTSCYRYDAAQNQWSGIAAIPTARSGPAAACLNGEVYVMGGAYQFILATVEVFDPVAGSWHGGPDLPEALWMPSAATFDGRIWVMGGFDAQFARSDRVYSLGADGVWQAETALPEALAGSAAATDGMRLVLAGGMNANGLPAATAIMQMSAAPPPPPPPPPPPTQDTLFCSVRVNPDVICTERHAHWVVATIHAEWPVSTIDVSAMTLAGVPAELGSTWHDDFGDDMSAQAFGKDDRHDGHDHRGDDDRGDDSHGEPNVLRVKFPMDGFSGLAAGRQRLQLLARNMDGAPVSGTAYVRVVGGEKNDRHTRRHPLFRPTNARGQNASAIQFTLEAPMDVRLELLDVQGRRVGEIASGWFAAGTHEVQVPSGMAMPSGVYFLRGNFGGDMQVTRFAVVR